MNLFNIAASGFCLIFIYKLIRATIDLKKSKQEMDKKEYQTSKYALWLMYFIVLFVVVKVIEDF